MNNYQFEASKRFRFGFVCFKKNSSPDTKSIDFWNRLDIDPFVILTHPETQTEIIRGLSSTAVFIGDFFVCDGDQTINELTLELIDNNNWDTLDKLSGRFALLILTEKGGKILNDPIGSRTIYYRKYGDFCVGSHSALIAELFDDEKNDETLKYMKCPEYQLRGTIYLPGDLTIYTNILGIIPNNYLDFETNKTKRFWPRKPLQSTEVRTYYKACDNYFLRLSDFIREKYYPVLGLTGGVDSRLLIANFKLNGIKFRTVTWKGLMITEKELSLVNSIAEYLRGDHRFIDLSIKNDSINWSEYQKLANLNTGFNRSFNNDKKQSITAAMGQSCKDGEIFIRGYGGEIMRGFYNIHDKIRYINQLNPKHLSKLYYTMRIINPDPSFDDFTIRAFEKFIIRANYSDDFYYNDPQDLFYWEQRMGMWGANMHNSLDPAIYSFTGMNSRVIFETAFGLQPSIRKTPDLILKTISRYSTRLGKFGRES